MASESGDIESSNARRSSVTNSAYKILIVGETGVGKSSLINLLINKDEAAISDGASGCTFQFRTYEYLDETTKKPWNFIDTVGLNEASTGTVNAHEAARKLIDFMRQNKQGFHGVLMVMKKGRITANFEKNHNLFVRTMLNFQVPCVLVISHCEEDEPMNEWKCDENNMKAISDYCFTEVVCGTMRKGGRFESVLVNLRNQTREVIFASLLEKMRPVPFRIQRDLNKLQKLLNILFQGLGIKKRFLSQSFNQILEYIKIDFELTEEEIQQMKLALQN